MEKSKNYVVFGVLALVVSLVAVSLAYAGFTATLNINGTANVKSAKWHVYFNETVTNSKTNTVTWTQAPTRTSETLISWGATFTTPGEVAEFDFTVNNDGNFDAKLETITMSTPSCTASGTNAAGVTTANSFLCSEAFELTLSETTAGEVNKIANIVNPTSTPALSNGATVLVANNAKPRTYHVKLEYLDKDDSTILPQADAGYVTIEHLDIQFGYVQEGSYKASL